MEKSFTWLVNRYAIKKEKFKSLNKLRFNLEFDQME